MMMKNYLSKLYAFSKCIKKETGRSHIFTFSDYALSLLLHGCTIRQYYVGGFYKQPFYVRKKTVTYRRWIEIMRKFNNPLYISKLDNKVEFLKEFTQFVYREWFYHTEFTKEDFKEFIGRNKEFIVKPINAMQGKGVCVLKLEDFESIDALYEKVVSEDLLCEQLIAQHSSMCFGNKSVNTIRAFTVLDKSGKAHVVKTVLRAGKGDSVVDNFCAGGVVYPLDIKTGIIHDKGIDSNGTEYMIHPGTELCMLGVQVPAWDSVMDFVRTVAESLPQMRFVGWDLAITKSGVDLVEGNHNPDHEFLEFLGERGMYNFFMQHK